jgi:hypothetical protein
MDPGAQYPGAQTVLVNHLADITLSQTLRAGSNAQGPASTSATLVSGLVPRKALKLNQCGRFLCEAGLSSAILGGLASSVVVVVLLLLLVVVLHFVLVVIVVMVALVVVVVVIVVVVLWFVSPITTSARDDLEFVNCQVTHAYFLL